MKDELFKELLESLEEGAAILAGEKKASRTFEYPEPDAGAIRTKLGLTQAAFAALLGISQRTLEGWEQKRRKPVGPARRLLEIAASYPEAFVNTARTPLAQTRSARINANKAGKPGGRRLQGHHK
jgi:putative transcriptional regulator